MRTFIFQLVILSGVTLAYSAEPGPTPTAATPPPATDANGSSSASGTTGSTSPETTAKITAGITKAAPSQAAEGAADVTDAAAKPDLPRNAIIRLPQFDVRDDKLPIFRERQLLTPEGQVDLVLRRHPGLKFGPLAFLNVRRGLEMLEEENVVERRKEMNELLRFSAVLERIAPPEPEAPQQSASVDVSE